MFLLMQTLDMYYRERKEYINPQLLALKKKKKSPNLPGAQINQLGNFGRAQINPRQLWACPYQSARQLWRALINQ